MASPVSEEEGLFVSDRDDTPADGEQLKPAICTVSEAESNKDCSGRDGGGENLQPSFQNLNQPAVEDAKLKYDTRTPSKTQYNKECSERVRGAENVPSSSQGSAQKAQGSHGNWVTKIMKPLRYTSATRKFGVGSRRLSSIAEDPPSNSVKTWGKFK